METLLWLIASMTLGAILRAALLAFSEPARAATLVGAFGFVCLGGSAFASLPIGA